MNSPLIVVLAGYAAGLMVGRSFQAPLSALFAAAFTVLSPPLLFHRLRPYLLWPLLALAGWTNLWLHTAILSPHDLRLLAGQEPMIAAVRGTLMETPRLKLVERDQQEMVHSLAEVKVTALRLGDDWQPAFGEILVATPEAPGPQFFG